MQLFILTSLLYIRKVEGLAFQSQLQNKIESKSVVHQVPSKKRSVQPLFHTVVHEHAAGNLLGDFGIWLLEANLFECSF